MENAHIDLIICDEGTLQVPFDEHALGNFNTVISVGHRLKNAQNKTASALKAMPTERRIILSGTPIQVSVEFFKSW